MSYPPSLRHRKMRCLFLVICLIVTVYAGQQEETSYLSAISAFERMESVQISDGKESLIEVDEKVSVDPAATIVDIGALLNSIEKRLTQSYMSEYEVEVDKKKILFSAAQRDLSAADQDATQAVDMSKEAKARLPTLEKTYNRLLTEYTFSRVDVKQQIDFINEIRDLLDNVDPSTRKKVAFWRGYFNSTITIPSLWIRYPLSNVLYSGMKGLVIPEGDGTVVSSLEGYCLFTFASMQGAGPDLRLSSTRLIINDIEVNTQIFDHRSGLRKVIHSAYGFVRPNQRIHFEAFQAPSSWTTTISAGSQSGTYSWFNFEYIGNNNAENVRRVFSGGCLGAEPIKGGAALWKKYCMDITTWGFKESAKFLTFDKSGTTVATDGFFRILFTADMLADTPDYKTRQARLKVCSGGDMTKCIVLHHTNQTEIGLATHKLDITLILKAGDIFYIETRILNVDDVISTNFIGYNKNASRLQIVYLGDKDTHTIYSGGCIPNEVKFSANINRVELGEFEKVRSKFPKFLDLFVSKGWTPFCTNLADYNTFLGNEFVVHAEGNFCVGKHGYYRIHAVMSTACSDDCKRKLRMNLIVKPVDGFFPESKNDEAGTIAETGGYADIAAGLQTTELDVTLPLKKGQCFYIQDYSDSVGFPTTGLRAPHVKQGDTTGVPEIGQNFIQVHRLHTEGVEGTFPDK